MPFISCITINNQIFKSLEFLKDILTYASPLKRFYLFSQTCKFRGDWRHFFHLLTVVVGEPQELVTSVIKFGRTHFLIASIFWGCIITSLFKTTSPQKATKVNQNSRLENFSYNFFSKNTKNKTEMVDMVLFKHTINQTHEKCKCID